MRLVYRSITGSCCLNALSEKAGFCSRRMRRWPSSSAVRMLSTPPSFLFHHLSSFGKSPKPSLLGKPKVLHQIIQGCIGRRRPKRIHESLDGREQRTVYCWPSFIAVGIGELVGSNAYYVAVRVVPLFGFPVAQAFDIPEDMVETSCSAEKWAGIMPQWMEEDVIDTFSDQRACLQRTSMLISSTGQVNEDIQGRNLTTTPRSATWRRQRFTC